MEADQGRRLAGIEVADDGVANLLVERLKGVGLGVDRGSGCPGPVGAILRSSTTLAQTTKPRICPTIAITSSSCESFSRPIGWGRAPLARQSKDLSCWQST